MKVFLAVSLPQETIQDLVQTVAEYKDTWQQSVNGRLVFVNKKIWHLTIKFCGEVTPVDIEPLKVIIRDIVKAHDPLFIETREITAIPPYQSKIIGVNLRRNDTFNALQGDISKALDDSDLLDKKFIGYKPPHITLARIKGDIHVDTSQLPIDFAHTIPITALTLFESNLTEQGPQYTALETFTL
ncbi:MAG: RNA 2',3'-cyclic phosphodiesterase [Patescibacteria group bacterium]